MAPEKRVLLKKATRGRLDADDLLGLAQKKAGPEWIGKNVVRRKIIY
ncbi:MAG: hypothetical protein JXK94_05260 [Deltaproteobacteria bacterium]|nr:hypothetical protein [Deltaproteobacteria bacterium]